MIEEREMTMEEEKKKRVAGIDVSKAGLDVWMKPGPAERYENSKEGIRALVKRLGRERVALAVYEPTGGYERQLEGELREGGIRGYRAHPNKVRAFARASGKEAKTDGIDAEVLALYGEVFGEEGAKEEEWDEERRDLQDIVRRRRQMVDQRAREKNRLEKRQSRQGRGVNQTGHQVEHERDRTTGSGIQESAGKEQGVEAAGGAVPECEGRGGTDSGNAGGRIAGTGARRWEGTDIAGGTGTVDARQRTAEGVSIDPRREGNGAEGVVPGGVERNTEAGKQTGEVLPAAAKAG